ncbi:phage head-binding domain-containing protein [Siccibacter turicensis]|uniref:tail fiber/spike domain-containing protein n=1 Tax=Siccibacter turicensis TaxID=357233 RepID=UPI003F56190C
MATQPTNLPVPSESPRDLKFNAGKIDEFVTSDEKTFVDRLGGKHRTIAGINYDANQAMLKYGYITKKSFEIGATLDTPNTVLQWESNGEFYRWDGSWTQPKVVPAGSTPDSTGGIGQGKWVGVGDATLRQQLSSTDGSSLIGTPDGSVESRLTGLAEEDAVIKSRLVTGLIPPSSPTIGNGVKAIMRIAGDDDFYVISKKANGKNGFIAQRVTNDVSPSNESNYGGASPLRPGSVDNIRDAISAKLVPSAKGSSVALSTFNASQIATLFGFNATGSSLNAATASGDYSLFSPQAYSIPNSSTVVYTLSAPRAVVRFGAFNTSSASVQISISRDGANWMLVDTINTLLPPGGQNPLPYDVNVNGLSGTWYLRVANAHANNAILVGINIGSIGGSEILDYDNFMATIEPVLQESSTPSYYFGGLGATEFAAKELSTGKFFGTFHGGHSNFMQRLRYDSGSYNLDNSTAPTLLLSKNAILHTTSDIVIGPAVYKYVASTQFGDGVSITNFSLKKLSDQTILCERVYTHMATSCRNFDWIHLPVLVNKQDDGDVKIGQTGFIQQFRSEDAATINCYFTQVNIDQNGFGGAYVSFQPNYNKQYYGAAMSSVVGVELPEGVFVTSKEFF